MKSLPTTWRERLASLANAFQPIVNIHTGIVLGVESLLRGVQDAGWETPMQLFDEAHGAGLLRPVSRAVRRRAVAAFTNLPFASRVKLFLNVDNRELDDWEALTGDLGNLLQACGLPLETVCLEVSEKLPAAAADFLWQRLAAPGVRPHKLAIDDFGAGFSGLKLLYQADPNFIKVDRFFVDGLANDPRKREFVSSVVRLAHVLGVLVIAEGVETLAELRECRAVGCDLVQGYFVQPPTTDLQALRPEYRVVEETSRRDRRQPHRDGDLVASYVEFLPAISIDTEMSFVLQFFRHESSLTFAPVINQHREPLGIIRESDLRQYAYSLYGKDLLRNPRLRSMLPRLIVRCPIADLRLRAEQILGLFSQAGGDEGILVVDNGVYVGFLSARSLLHLLNEKNLHLARDQNPLSRLPGNTLIYEVLSEALQSGTEHATVVYFDFNSFKPFNDTYGFRAGDRAIVLFAESFQRSMMREGCFLGHIGGDDFFALVKGSPPTRVIEQVAQLVTSFARDVASLYSESDRQRGFIEAPDRSGQIRHFPLLTVSAAVLFIPAGPPRGPLDEVISALAAMKRTAKGAPQGFCYGVLGPDSRISVEIP